MELDKLLGEEIVPVNLPTADEKTLAILCHVLTVIFPILAPLIIYILKAKDSEFVSHHAKESLNFQITLIICYIISGILILLLIGILMLIVLSLINLILVIVAAVRASEGKLYRYPFCIRFIK